MKEFARALALATLLMLFATTAASPDVISVRSVSDLEVDIHTPWGNYVAYSIGNGYYWVGTEREFEHARVTAAARDLGFRPSAVKMEGADESYVLTSSFKTQVGRLVLDGIDPGILFRVPVKPHRPTSPLRRDTSW